MDSIDYGKFPEGTKEKLDNLRSQIDKALSGYENYNGISFTAYSDRIVIQMRHKLIKGYYFGGHFDLNKDLSNYNEAFDAIIANWKAADTPEYINYIKDFISWGEKYGWD